MNDDGQFQAASVEDLEKAVRIVLAQYREGTVDLTRVTQIEQNLVLALDTLAQARGEIGLGLTQVYRALGGGWELRTQKENCGPETMTYPPVPAESPAAPGPQPLPAPKPLAESE